MQAYRKSQFCSLLQGFFQNGRIHDGNAVVCEARRPGPGESVEIDHFFSLHSDGDIGAAVEMDLFLFSPLQNILKDGDAVHGRLCVGHQNDAGIAAPGSSQRTSVQIFLISEAGVPEMSVGVDQTGRRTQPPPVDQTETGVCFRIAVLSRNTAGRRAFYDFLESASFDKQVGLLLDSGGGVIQIHVFDHKHGKSFPRYCFRQELY